MNREGMLQDLKALHSGRGLRRVNLRASIGPDLGAAVGAASHGTDAELRAALGRFLARHSQPLPDDLRHLFRMAVGLEANHPTLEQRMELVGQTQDRSVRVLRRRLREAEELVADSVLDQQAGQGNWWDAVGWQWLGIGLHLVLRRDAVLTMDQEVLALADGQRFVHGMFTIPRLDPHEEPTFEAVAGVTLLQVERTSPTGWRLSYELPRELAVGESLLTQVRMRLPRASALQPYLAIAPVRDYPRAVVEVDFGTRSGVQSCWVLEGVLPSDLGEPGTLPAARDARPASGLVRREFTSMHVGLAYGIAWQR